MTHRLPTLAKAGNAICDARDAEKMAQVFMEATSKHTREYTIMGSEAEVTEAIAQIVASYPPDRYGTWFNWPPGSVSPKGKPIEYYAPRMDFHGKWMALGFRWATANCVTEGEA